MRYILTSVLATQLGTAAWAEVPAVVADIPPVQSLVAMVMGDLGRPVLLAGQGGAAHDLQLRPGQVAAIAKADLVVWVGPDMSPWLAAVLDGGATGARVVGLLDAEGTVRQAFGATHAHGSGRDAPAAGQGDGGGQQGDAAETGADAGHGAEGSAAEHGVAEADDHAGADPHAWLDPQNASAWVGAIAAELARLDPANAAAYAANADTARARIAGAEAQAAATLGPVRDRPFFVYHDAYGYFAAHFGLTVAGAVAEGDAAQPGAARLRALQAAAATGPTCIFPEANQDPALSMQLAEAAGARLGGALDPEGSALTPGPDLYVALVTGLAATLADCLSRR